MLTNNGRRGAVTELLFDREKGFDTFHVLFVCVSTPVSIKYLSSLLVTDHMYKVIFDT